LLPAPPFNFSISQPIVSVTAFSNQFFMLFSDGEVKSLPLTNGVINPSALPIPVQTSLSIPTPLPIVGSNYKAFQPVPTVTLENQTGSTPLIVSTTTTTTTTVLASGEVSGVPHLYIGDSTNHRVLDLEIPTSSGTSTPTATSTPASASLTMQLVQQFVSSQFLNAVKSVAVDPLGATVNILAQNPSQLNLVSVNSGLQAGCASGS
jgi:hypothetical protein